MQVKLKDIADIQFGYYTQPGKLGTISYLQAKHFNDFGQYIGENDTFVEEDEKSVVNLLEDGDILFAGKGFRFFATLYKKEFGKAIASSIFFIIKPKTEIIEPGYLVSILNLPKSLLHFQQSGAGSSIPSIRKSELEDFSINLIPMEQQRKIVAIQELYLKDLELTEKLIKEKHKLYQASITKVIN